MSAFIVKCAAAVVSVFGLSSATMAAAITVTNYSFESATTDGSNSVDVPDGFTSGNVAPASGPNHGYDAQGWTFVRAGGSDSETGVVDPLNSSSDFTSNNPLSGTADGLQAARVHLSFFAGTGSLTTSSSVASMVAGVTYTLTVAIGESTNYASTDSTSIALLGNGAALTLGSGSSVGTYLATDLTNKTFVDKTISYTAAAGDAGKALTIRLSQTYTLPVTTINGTNHRDVFFDNVRLSDSTGVPEPTALALLALGAPIALRRRQNA